MTNNIFLVQKMLKANNTVMPLNQFLVLSEVVDLGSSNYQNQRRRFNRFDKKKMHHVENRPILTALEDKSILLPRSLSLSPK